MYQTWSWLGFLHWSYPRQVVQRLLPEGLRPHTFDGRAWVGLTPFLLQDLRTPVAPALPWFTSFPETNLRTYVVGPDGREGLWFLSLDAGRLEPVLFARSTYRLPYMWSEMEVERDGSTVRYRSRRRWPARPRPPRPVDRSRVRQAANSSPIAAQIRLTVDFHSAASRPRTSARVA